MQAHARLCEENKLEAKNDTYWNNFAVKGASLKDHIGRVQRLIKTIFSRIVHHRINVLVIVSKLSIIACVRQLLAVVTEMSTKPHRLAGS